MWIRRLVTAIILVSLSGALSIVGTTRAAYALSVSDYFTYSYAFAFSKSSVVENEPFSVTVSGQAVCVQNLPMSVSSASLVSKVVAKNRQTGAEVVLNPSFTISYDSSFPTRTGQTANASMNVTLVFPSGSPVGTYDITGDLSKAVVNFGPIPLEVTRYLPATEAMGTVTLTNVNPPAVITTAATSSTTPLALTTSTTTTSVTTTASTTVFTTPATPVQTTQTTTSATTTTATTETASFVLSDFKVTSYTVDSGKTITITVELANTGVAAGSYNVGLNYDGQMVNSQTINLVGKASQSVTFTHQVNAEGQHTVSIGSYSAQITVNPPGTENDTLKWWIMGGIGGIVLGTGVGVGVLWALRRKKA